tara:strand:- start:592 stop:906 length:315 start_codon:yes stop_codon:yes gene_type:complete
MMNNTDDTDVVVEYGVPVPTGLQNKREALPDMNLGEMKGGSSFFLATTSDEHTLRKMRAVRSAILRSSRPRSSFRLFRWQDEKTEKRGVRVFCVEDDDETDESV